MAGWGCVWCLTRPGGGGRAEVWFRRGLGRDELCAWGRGCAVGRAAFGGRLFGPRLVGWVCPAGGDGLVCRARLSGPAMFCEREVGRVGSPGVVWHRCCGSVFCGRKGFACGMWGPHFFWGSMSRRAFCSPVGVYLAPEITVVPLGRFASGVGFPGSLWFSRASSRRPVSRDHPPVFKGVSESILLPFSASIVLEYKPSNVGNTFDRNRFGIWRLEIIRQML